MPRINVKPSGDTWIANKRGVWSSTHRTKNAAKKEARRRGNPGDKLYIYGSDGTIMEVKTLR